MAESYYGLVIAWSAHKIVYNIYNHKLSGEFGFYEPRVNIASDHREMYIKALQTVVSRIYQPCDSHPSDGSPLASFQVAWIL